MHAARDLLENAILLLAGQPNLLYFFHFVWHGNIFRPGNSILPWNHFIHGAVDSPDDYGDRVSFFGQSFFPHHGFLQFQFWIAQRGAVGSVDRSHMIICD